MKSLSTYLLIGVLLFSLSACAEQPLTEEQQAASYGMTLDRYREEKSAAARMNMSIEEHMKMLDGGHTM